MGGPESDQDQDHLAMCVTPLAFYYAKASCQHPEDGAEGRHPEDGAEGLHGTFCPSCHVVTSKTSPFSASQY